MLEHLSQLTTLPNLHPALVHFPLALAPVALLADLVALILRRPLWLDRAAALLWGLAAIGAALARETGKQADEALVDIPPRVQLAIGEHSEWARWALWAVVGMALLRLGLAWWEHQSPRLGRLPARALLAIAAMAAVGLLLRTADLGGALVYRHAVAVAVAVEKPEELSGAGAAPVAELSESSESRLVNAGDGSLAWTPLPGDAKALGTVLGAARGSSLEAVTWYEPGSGEGEGLPVRVGGRALLVLPGSFGDVRLELEVSLENLVGTVGVVHHVVDAGTAGVFRVATGGEVVLEALAAGTSRQLDHQPFEPPVGSPFTLAVSAAGRHLKGFVDGRQLTHGHLAPGEDGAVGLLLEGEGVVRIHSLRVIPLAGG